MVEVKLCSGKPTQLSKELLVGLLERQIKKVYQDLAESVVVVHCPTVQRHLHK